MILPILGMAFVIIATYFVYKNAQEYGRNAIVWALITFLVGIGFQWVFPFFLAVIWMILLIVKGNTTEEAQSTIISYSLLITIGSLLLSGFAVLLIVRFVSRMPEEKSFVKPPSPPTSF